MKRLLQLSLVAIFAVAAAGCDGSDPIAGDAGIVSVNDFTFNPATGTLNDNVVSQQFTVPAIDLNVVEHGAVLAYFREQGTWTAMPFTYGVESADPELPAVDYTVTIGYAFEHRLLEVFYEVSAVEAIDPLDLPATDIKVVVLQNLAASKNGPDLRNYEEVARYYGLED